VNGQLSIETPEQIALEFPLAGIGSRFLALFIDLVLQGLVYVAAFLLSFFGIAAMHGLPGWMTNWIWALYGLAAFVIYTGYFALFETFWNGQTPGKRYAGIRVIKDSGRAITGFEALTRNLLRIVDQLPGVYAVGVITMLCSRESKRLGDFAAGTVVVRETQNNAWLPNWSAGGAADAPLYDVTRLSVADLEVIEMFLQRRLDLSPTVRVETGQRLCRRLADTLGVAPEQIANPDNFLEAVAMQLRNRTR